MTKAHFRVLATAAYVVVMAAVVFGLFRARRWSLSAFSDTAAQTQWNTYREDVVQQTQQGASVQRRVPKSVEPPGLVLMRDYFPVCTTIAVVLTSALFVTTAFFVGGVLVRPPSPWTHRQEPPPEEPRG